jgi:hypothetical protein
MASRYLNGSAVSLSVTRSLQFYSTTLREE